jgi:hypothetical protein
MMKRRPEVFIILFAGLIALCGWSYLEFTTSQDKAAGAAEDVMVCRRLAEQIKKLQVQPLRAATEARSSTEVARLIESSAKVAGLPTTSILQIDPQSPRRLGNSAYKEQPTHVELRDINLRQLVVFLHTLAADEQGLDLAELRLSAPREQTDLARAEETWLAEVTLTHLIYAP